MPKEKDEAEKIALSYLESQRMNRIADYVSRGRAYENLSDDDVNKGWRNTMKAMALDPANRIPRGLNNDYESELGLRGLSPPEGTEEAEQFLAVTKRVIEEKMADPEERERIMKGLAEDLSDFHDQKDRGS